MKDVGLRSVGNRERKEREGSVLQVAHHQVLQ